MIYLLLNTAADFTVVGGSIIAECSRL